MITLKGAQMPWHENLTVGEIVKKMVGDEPILLVRVNETIVKRKNWEAFRVPDGSTVDVYYAVAGG